MLDENDDELVAFSLAESESDTRMQRGSSFSYGSEAGSGRESKESTGRRLALLRMLMGLSVAEEKSALVLPTGVLVGEGDVLAARVEGC